MGTFKHFITVGSISLFGTFANFLLNEAIVHGKAGPSQALVEIQSIWLLFLEVFFMNKIPTNDQTIGFFVGIFGGSFLICDPK